MNSEGIRGIVQEVETLSRDSLKIAVETLLSECQRLIAASGQSDLRDRLRREQERYASRAGASVVVVGETKRGKSSLINALVGRPGLLPVDADVATGVYVEVRHASQSTAVIHRQTGAIHEQVAIDTISQWISVAENPENTKEVDSVEVGLDSPLLAQGIRIIDTPGVGGLVSGHTAITLGVLQWADALVFVTDPGAPLTASELSFLSRASERIANVVLVLAKTDAYQHWRENLEDDRSRISQHVPSLAHSPWVAVSSRLKTLSDASAASGDSDLAEKLRSASGFALLEEELIGRIVKRTSQLRLENLVHVCIETCSQLRKWYRGVLESLDGNPAFMQDLEAEERRWKDFRHQLPMLERKLGDDFRRLQQRLIYELQNGIQGLQRAYEQHPSIGSAEFLQELPRKLNQDLQGLAASVNQDFLDEMPGLLERPTASGSLSLSPEMQLDGSWKLELHASSPGPRRADPSERWGNLMYLMVGQSMASIVSVGAGIIGIPIFPGLPQAVGLLIGTVNVKMQKRRQQLARGQQEASRLIRDALNEGQRQIQTEISDRILANQRAFEESFSTEVQRRLDESEAKIAALKKELQDQSRRKLQKERLAGDVATVDRLLQRAQLLAADIGVVATRTSTASPVS